MSNHHRSLGDSYQMRIDFEPVELSGIIAVEALVVTELTVDTELLEHCKVGGSDGAELLENAALSSRDSHAADVLRKIASTTIVSL